MAKSRLMATDVNDDEFVGNLSFYERCLWFGLCLSMADDQGRMMANHKVICAKVFPYDENITSEKIAATIQGFLQVGKLFVYSDEKGRTLYQIVNWWNWQIPQEWPQPSKFQAPPGWIDRVRYHGKDRKITVLNWDLKPGFENNSSPDSGYSLPSRLPNSLGRPIRGRGIEEEDKEEESGEELRKPDTFDQIQEIAIRLTGLMVLQCDLKTLYDWEREKVTEDDIRGALQWREDNDKPPIKTISQLAGGVKTERLKRIQGGNGRDSPGRLPQKPEGMDDEVFQALEYLRLNRYREDVPGRAANRLDRLKFLHQKGEAMEVEK